jgi:hypothetical protein
MSGALSRSAETGRNVGACSSPTAVTTVGLTESQKAQIDLMFDAQRSRFMIFEPGSEARQGFSALVEERSSVLAELEPVGEVGEK